VVNDSLDIRPIQAVDIPAIARLMLSVHGKKTRLNEAYLTWQYVDNPDGEVIGYNAWDGAVLVAHYACMPVTFTNAGAEASSSVAHRWLWSLNTATHPDYRGQGLFSLLAKQTYDWGLDKGFSAVIGLANAQSAGGFEKKLGFSTLGRLSVYLSVHSTFEMNGLSRQINLSHRLRALKRLNNNPDHILVAYRGIPLVGKVLEASTHRGPHLYVGLQKPTSLIGFKIPEWLKPSPWVVVYRELGDGPKASSPELPLIQIEMLDSDSI
jgi:GNAT superfamily N-acetyltransferase